MRIQKISLVKNLLLTILFSAGSLFAELTDSQRAWLAEINRPLRIATYEGFAPFSFYDHNGKVTGILPDFSRWIDKQYGIDIELIPVAAGQIREGVRSGQFDAAFLYTPQWQKESLICTASLIQMPPRVYVPVNSPVKTLNDLAGKVVALEPHFVDLLAGKDTTFEMLKCASFEETINAVEEGRAAAFISGIIPVEYYLSSQKKFESLQSIDELSAKGNFVLCTRGDNRVLQEILSDAAAESDRQGLIRRMRRDWRIGSRGGYQAFVIRYTRYIIIAIGVLLLAVLFFWLWDVRLNSQVQKKTRALRSSEERLRTIFQNSPDAIFIENAKGVVLDANPAACHFHGLAYNELIGRSVLDLIPEDRRAEVENSFPKWFSKELMRYEGVSVNAEGRDVPVEVIGTPLQYEGQMAVLLMVRDMTERERADRALRKSEKRYRGLIEVQNSFIARMDVEGRFTFVNEALCRFLGRSRAELIGEFFQPFAYYDDLDLSRQALTALVREKEKMAVTEYRVRSKTHVAWVHWEATAIYNDAGNVVEIQTVGRDVTERRRIHDALQESEKRLRFLFEEIPHIAVQGYDEKHEIIFWNRASELLYGYPRKEAIGKKIEDLLAPPERRSEIAEAIDLWVKTGQPMPAGEEMKSRADGQLVPVYSSRLTTWNKSNERELYVIDVDLSELKRASEALVKAKEFAERANRAKSEFLANMSHEIRTPMNGVMGMTHLLLETKLDDEQHENVQTIMDSTKELLTIIDELLDISRIEAGEVRLQMEPFSPRKTVEKVVLLFADRAGKKGIDMSVDIHPDVPEKMMGDAGRIRQVLINLVGNALKFTHEGNIRIRLLAEKADQGWRLKADVKDTGVGMGLELQQRVFDKFTQGDSSSTREHGGAGLGLAISKQLIELMGGTISVASDVGQGTTFSFNILLPELETAEVPMAPPVPPVAKKSEKLTAKILLVEDNLVNQKVATAMIKKSGCTVTVAKNGAEALKVIPDQKFDLIFMDCQMPIMDGFETTRAIRQMVGEIRDIPIVAMTAHALKEDRQKCLDAGMDDYLAKPVHRDKLCEVLQKYCG